MLDKSLYIKYYIGHKDIPKVTESGKMKWTSTPHTKGQCEDPANRQDLVNQMDLEPEHHNIKHHVKQIESRYPSI